MFGASLETTKVSTFVKEDTANIAPDAPSAVEAIETIQLRRPVIIKHGR